jgi:hypothetical protein
MEGIKAQRTFGTTGPLVFFTVNGKGPGEEVALRSDSPAPVQVKAEATSIALIEKLEVIVNGRVAQATAVSSDPHRLAFDGAVAVPDGGWVAIRVVGPSSKYVTDSYAFALTSPVYVVRGGRRWTSADDAAFLGQVVDAIWARVDGPRAPLANPGRARPVQGRNRSGPVGVPADCHASALKGGTWQSARLAPQGAQQCRDYLTTCRTHSTSRGSGISPWVAIT